MASGWRRTQGLAGLVLQSAGPPRPSLRFPLCTNTLTPRGRRRQQIWRLRLAVPHAFAWRVRIYREPGRLERGKKTRLLLGGARD